MFLIQTFTIICTSHKISKEEVLLMEAISYSRARENLAKTMDRVCKDHDVVIITRKKSEAVVMMSLEDFNAIEETGYLLKSPTNAQRLRDSIKQYEQGKCQKQKLIEE